MGRLIDKDELIKNIKQEHDKTTIIPIERLFGIIDEQPTAYDVDKVIEQLEELIYPNLTNDYKYVVNKCIEIVKAGVEIKNDNRN